jgi:hypothetical protein
MQHYNKHLKEKLKWLNNTDKRDRYEAISDILAGISLFTVLLLLYAIAII